MFQIEPLAEPNDRFFVLKLRGLSGCNLLIKGS